MAEKHRCSARVNVPGVWGGSPCTREGTAEEPLGTWWCYQHSPQAKAKRRAKWQAKYEADGVAWNKQRDIEEAESAYRDACVWVVERLLAHPPDDPQLTCAHCAQGLSVCETAKAALDAQKGGK